jgi:threonine/homoserine/homoserine lactone efflux protein
MGVLMSVAWIAFVTLGTIGIGLLLWLGWRWLARSWEVLDDDQLSERLEGRAQHSPIAWLRLRGWFPRKQRRLTYRRDERGRFRKIRR